jgi:hypothetical protein
MFGFVRKSIVAWLTHQRPPLATPLSDFDRIRYEAKPGDVILVEGRSRVSDVIKLITQSSWSHAVLYIGRLHDIEDPSVRESVRKNYSGSAEKQLIIESELGLGTVVRPINVYAAEHLRICRPRGLNYAEAQSVIRYCIGRLGTPYDVRQIFDLARFLFPWWILPRRWRSSLFSSHPGQNTHTVCSTMIAEAFGSIQFPILPLVKRVTEEHVQLFMRNPKLCVPRDFDYSPHFDIIKYPFLDFRNHSRQRLTPWTGNAELSEAERDMYIAAENESAAAGNGRA